MTLIVSAIPSKNPLQYSPNQPPKSDSKQPSKLSCITQIKT
jgi:hypothetical protein